MNTSLTIILLLSNFVDSMIKGIDLGSSQIRITGFNYSQNNYVTISDEHANEEISNFHAFIKKGAFSFGPVFFKNLDSSQQESSQTAEDPQSIVENLNEHLYLAPFGIQTIFHPFMKNLLSGHFGAHFLEEVSVSLQNYISPSLPDSLFTIFFPNVSKGSSGSQESQESISKNLSLDNFFSHKFNYLQGLLLDNKIHNSPSSLSTPLYYSAIHRAIIKNSAGLAGLKLGHLAEENAMAVYKFASSSDFDSLAGNIIIAVNFGHVATTYSAFSVQLSEGIKKITRLRNGRSEFGGILATFALYEDLIRQATEDLARDEKTDLHTLLSEKERMELFVLADSAKKLLSTSQKAKKSFVRSDSKEFILDLHKETYEKNSLFLESLNKVKRELYSFLQSLSQQKDSAETKLILIPYGGNVQAPFIAESFKDFFSNSPENAWAKDHPDFRAILERLDVRWRSLNNTDTSKALSLYQLQKRLGFPQKKKILLEELAEGNIEFAVYRQNEGSKEYTQVEKRVVWETGEEVSSKKSFVLPFAKRPKEEEGKADGKDKTKELVYIVVESLGGGEGEKEVLKVLSFDSDDIVVPEKKGSAEESSNSSESPVLSEKSINLHFSFSFDHQGLVAVDLKYSAEATGADESKDESTDTQAGTPSVPSKKLSLSTAFPYFSKKNNSRIKSMIESENKERKEKKELAKLRNGIDESLISLKDDLSDQESDLMAYSKEKELEELNEYIKKLSEDGFENEKFKIHVYPKKSLKEIKTTLDRLKNFSAKRKRERESAQKAVENFKESIEESIREIEGKLKSITDKRAEEAKKTLEEDFDDSAEKEPEKDKEESRAEVDLSEDEKKALKFVAVLRKKLGLLEKLREEESQKALNEDVKKTAFEIRELEYKVLRRKDSLMKKLQMTDMMFNQEMKDLMEKMKKEAAEKFLKDMKAKKGKGDDGSEEKTKEGEDNEEKTEEPAEREAETKEEGKNEEKPEEEQKVNEEL